MFRDGGWGKELHKDEWPDPRDIVELQQKQKRQQKLLRFAYSSDVQNGNQFNKCSLFLLTVGKQQVIDYFPSQYALCFLCIETNGVE